MSGNTFTLYQSDAHLIGLPISYHGLHCRFDHGEDVLMRKWTVQSTIKCVNALRGIAVPVARFPNDDVDACDLTVAAGLGPIICVSALGLIPRLLLIPVLVMVVGLRTLGATTAIDRPSIALGIPI